jgi:excisionase family DNA binding protein
MSAPAPDGDHVSLREAAEILGVHYMTAYRHVRTGRLPAEQAGGQWRVRRSDLAAVGDGGTGTAPSPRTRARRRDEAVSRLVRRLVAGDEPGAWALVEAALVGGAEPEEVHLELLAPAMKAVGDGWAAGAFTVDEEHAASAVCHRLVGRLGPRFARPGRSRGTVVLAAAPGDPHALPVALAADVVRAAGWSVVDLGASVPAESLARAATRADRLVAVAVSASADGHLDDLADAVAAVRAAVPSASVLVGGSAVDAATAARLGADGWAADAADLVERLRPLRPRRRATGA